MKTFTAPFAQTPKTASAVVTVADTTIDDAPVNTILLATAGAEGSILTKLSAMPRATVTATSLHLWLSKDNGVTKRLLDSVLMAAHTVATTTAIPKTSFAGITETAPVRLQAGDELYVGAGVALASGVVFTAELTDY